MIRNEMNFIRNMAHSFHRTTGIDFDELVSEASLAFAEAAADLDEERGDLSTYAYVRMQRHLSNVTKKNRRSREVFADLPLSEIRSLNTKDDDEADLREALAAYSTTVTPEAITDIRERISASSTDCQTLVRIVFEAPGEFLSLAGRGAKGRLRAVLRKRGWSWPRIWSALREARELVEA